jgi:hypothetical protein
LRLNPDDALGGTFGSGVGEPGADDEDASDFVWREVAVRSAEAVFSVEGA